MLSLDTLFFFLRSTVPWQFGRVREWNTVTMQQKQPIRDIHNILEANLEKALCFKLFSTGLGL